MRRLRGFEGLGKSVGFEVSSGRDGFEGFTERGVFEGGEASAAFLKVER